MKLSQKIDLTNNDSKRNIWFMSDLHYGHQNIIRIGNRPFSGVEKMNEYIISEISSKVNQTDILFDLGDLIWKESPEDVSIISSLLPIHSYRILGNHDSLNLGAWGKTWEGVYDLLDIIIKSKEGEDIQITLSHYPILDWNHMFRGSWNLHGHCHGNVDKENQESGKLRLDVGFDGKLAKEIGSFLIPFEVVLSKMKEKVGNMKFREWAREKDSRS